MIREFIINFIRNNDAFLIKSALRILFSFIILWICHHMSTLSAKKIASSQGKYKSIDPMIIPMMTRATRYAIYTIGIMLILALFGVSTASLAAILGAAGLGIGLALKDTLGNVAAGLLLLLLKPFRPEQVIECDGILGTVKHVDLFSTVVDTPDGIYVSIPNSTLISNPIKNFTRNRIRRMDIVIGISYGDSIDDGFDTLKAIINEEKRFLKTPTPQVMVQAMADSSVNLQLRAWASVDDYWAAYWDTMKKSKEYIEAAGLTIPFPQRDLHVIHHNPSQTESKAKQQPTVSPSLEVLD
jgi:small conductance mechanosensitive channel